ncbi:MAG: hypothetical protein LBU40_01885 [Methanobrevibacter sp.]|jgi:hypothetical protein|nr:hypothetical protein [Methanobrevibacter sp.]
MKPQPCKRQTKLIILFVLVVGIISVCLYEIQSVTPVELTGNESFYPEPLKIVFESNGSSVAPLSVKMNSTDIYCYGVYPSVAGFKYKRYNTHIKNYFELTNETGVLSLEVGSGKHNPEGMLVYYGRNKKYYDMDFSLVGFKEHIIGSERYLQGEII